MSVLKIGEGFLYFLFIVSRVDAALALAEQKSAEGIMAALWAGQGFCCTPVCRAAFVRLPEAGTQDCQEVILNRDSSYCLSYSESLFGNYTKNESLANRGESCEGRKQGTKGWGCEELWGRGGEQGCEVLSCRGY